MTGNYATDMSDASGTTWLNVAKREWSEELLAATGLNNTHMPELAEGSNNTGTVLNSITNHWGIPSNAKVVAGGGDNAASAISMNIIYPEHAFISLGTSGVYFVATDSYSSNPEQAVHSFCHCLPNQWHQMTVHLSAANSLNWLTKTVGETNIEKLVAEAEAKGSWQPGLVFLPYLSGERSPHNNPHAKGVLFGLTNYTSRADITQAVLIGIAMALEQGQAAME